MNQELQQAAEAALSKWLNPQPVKGLDYPLCFTGRIRRAMEIGSKAMAEKDAAKVEHIKTVVISDLERQQDAARNEAKKAVDALLLAGGRAPSVTPCTCKYCLDEERTKQAIEAVWNAEERLRRAVHPLLEPTADGMPLPLSLMRAGDEQRLMGMIKELAEAQAEYFDKCTLFQKPLAWGYVLKGM